MNMKYHNELQEIPSCPPPSCQARKMTAYRYVFSPVDVDGFIPQGMKSPGRISASNDNQFKCSLMGLSMFVSQHDAEARFRYLKGKYKNLKKTLGSHLAVGQLTPSMGVASVACSSGHFDFFEFQGISLVGDFSIVCELED